MKNLQIRNSTAEFLIFTKQNKEKTIEVIVDEESVWLSQKLMAELFGTTRNNITMHLKDIYDSKELDEKATSKDFLLVQKEGQRDVKRNTKYYSLDAIIAVGFKVNSERELLQEIREIRISERNFYQKITDIYSTSLDYNSASPITQEFFKTVQNKMHYATHGNTAAEVIVERANHEKEHMGLTNWKNSPKGKIMASDVIIAKNYLTKDELKSLERIVTMYLDYAEDQAERHIPMTMEDWKKRLDVFLQFNQREVLDNPGKVSHKVAESFALSEFEKYRVIQDKLFESDFDKFLLDMKNENLNK